MAENAIRRMTRQALSRQLQGSVHEAYLEAALKEQASGEITDELEPKDTEIAWLQRLVSFLVTEWSDPSDGFNCPGGSCPGEGCFRCCIDTASAECDVRGRKVART